jgi:hypothetical protein
VHRRRRFAVGELRHRWAQLELEFPATGDVIPETKRRRRIDIAYVLRALDAKRGPVEIARELGCDHAHISRIKSKYRPALRPVRELPIRARRCWTCGIVARDAAANRSICPRGHTW